MVRISSYDACCNIGSNIHEIYVNAIDGLCENFTYSDKLILGKNVRIGKINADLPEIENPDFNIRCNKLILYNFKNLKPKISELLTKYSLSDIGIVVATTNSGVEEFADTENIIHSELGNPALFVKEYLGLKGFYTTVSTACSSGIKAFTLANDLINSDICKAVIVIGVDSLARVPIFGFNALSVLSDTRSIPFSKNRNGINIGEAVATFVLEKDTGNIKILGTSENTDTYHSTTPNPEATEVINAINIALNNANIEADDIDYINLHCTGTIANDMMEANAIAKVFGSKIPVSSTKQLTGHCLGAAASIETALCCYLLENFEGKLYPHIYDNCYDESLPQIKLVNKNDKFNKCDICMCNAFGFGGTNAVIILGKCYG